jgi:transposase
MGKAHSLDIRARIVGMVEGGQSCRAAARHFGVSDSTAIKLMQHRRRTGTVSPLRQGRPPGSGKLAAHRTFLIGAVEDKPDITMPELARRLEESHGVRVPPSSLSRFLLSEGFTYKKSTDGVGARTRESSPGA